ncbi:MAG TPA: alpha/beta fold hydrolase, partial [Ornithinimicrobium sp.]|nr:alpha/beta fold hydrolase [Ornithinimicrobium sp.]
MRAAQPVREGRVERAGVGTAFAVHGTDGPTVFLLMPNVITQSRAWKAQVPFLSRTCRVVTADPRGNGASDRPTDPEAYAVRELVEDAWAVLEEVGAPSAVLVGLCSGASQALVMAAEQPDRVPGVVAINPSLPLTPPHPWRVAH